MQSGDLESRVSALEVQVRDLNSQVRTNRQDTAAARILAGAADRDVSEFRGELRDLRRDFRDFRQTTETNFDALRNATTASFNAMRQDFVDLRDHVDKGFEQVDNGFIEMRGKLDATAVGQQRIVDLVQTVIDNQVTDDQN